MQRLFLISIIIVTAFSCRRDDEENGGVLYDNQNMAFAASIDSVVYAFNTAQTPYVGNSSFDVDYNQPSAPNTARYSAQIYVPSTLRPSILIRKGELSFNDSLPSDSLFESWFQPGIYNYSINALNGFEVLWVDMNGTLWNTSEMNGDQTGHTFRISNSRSFIDSNGIFCVKFNAEFSCNLYHPAYPSMLLADGVFEGIIRKQ